MYNVLPYDIEKLYTQKKQTSYNFILLPPLQVCGMPPRKLEPGTGSKNTSTSRQQAKQPNDHKNHIQYLSCVNGATGMLYHTQPQKHFLTSAILAYNESTGI